MEFLVNGWWRSVLDFLILYFLIYFVLLRVRGTRSLQVLFGLLNITLIFVVAWLLDLQTLNTLRSILTIPLLVGVIMIMAPEFRRSLVEFRLTGFFRRSAARIEAQVVHEIAHAAELLSQRRWGALIVLEREASLEGIAETGTKLDHEVQSELLVTVFTPNSPLHDGAVLISNTRIVAAACLLPLSERQDLSMSYGTRHRAAIGLTEQMDAVVVVVSEETGIISLAVEGNITRNLDPAGLEEVLQTLLEGKEV